VRYHIVAGSQFSGSLDMQEKKTWPHKNSTGKKGEKVCWPCLQSAEQLEEMRGVYWGGGGGYRVMEEVARTFCTKLKYFLRLPVFC